jgi:hypothetical protein
VIRPLVLSVREVLMGDNAFGVPFNFCNIQLSDYILHVGRVLPV